MAENDKNDRTPDNATTEPTDTVEGQSFYNHALTGSGTITVNGTYAEPLPDPTQIRGLGPERTSGGRLVPSVLDPESVKVAEVTEAVAGSRNATPGRGDDADTDNQDADRSSTDRTSTPAKKTTGPAAGRTSGK